MFCSILKLLKEVCKEETQLGSDTLKQRFSSAIKIIVIGILLYLWDSSEGTPLAIPNLLGKFCPYELVGLAEERERSINVVQSMPTIFVVFYYLSPAMYIKAFSYSTCLCPVILITLQACYCSCNINICDPAKMFRIEARICLHACTHQGWHTFRSQRQYPKHMNALCKQNWRDQKNWRTWLQLTV